MYLHPMDLLNLARTTKDFRSFLMKKSAAPFWKAARKNVEGLPECPEDLSEPQYVNLLFDAHCHVSALFVSAEVSFSCRIIALS